MKDLGGLKHLLKFKELAEGLKDRDLTVNLMIEGDTVVRMGAGADPGMLSCFGPIEVKDLKGVLKVFRK